MSTKINQNYSCQGRGCRQPPVNLHLQASYTHLSVSFYFEGHDVALRGMGLFFSELAEQKCSGTGLLLKMQNQWSSCDLNQDGKKQSLDEWNGSMDAVEAALVLEKILNQALLDLHVLGSANTDCHFCDFLESHFLEAEVKLIKKMSNHLTKPHKLADPPGLGRASIS